MELAYEVPICQLDYKEMADERLLERVRIGDKEALEILLKRYINFVKSKARPYFLIGADHEDIFQEGMIGLYKAIRDFKGDKMVSFKSFAEVCIVRQIITAIKTATRQKHIPLNSYISLDKPCHEDSDRTLYDTLTGEKGLNPEQAYIRREENIAIEQKISSILSDLEKEVLMLYLDGKTYNEIALDLNRQVKSIDNALQRVKKKLEKHLVCFL